MAKGITATFQDFKNVSDFVSDKADDFASQISSINTQTNDLRGNWTGDASVPFYEAYDNMKRDLDNFQTTLENLSVGIMKAGQIYEQNENEITTIAKGGFGG